MHAFPCCLQDVKTEPHNWLDIEDIQIQLPGTKISLQLLAGTVTHSQWELLEEWYDSTRSTYLHMYIWYMYDMHTQWGFYIDQNPRQFCWANENH